MQDTLFGSAVPRERCKSAECDYEGPMRLYVGFFVSERINKASQQDSALPKYGFHLGGVCPRCGKYQKFYPQTNELMLGVRYYAE